MQNTVVIKLFFEKNDTNMQLLTFNTSKPPIIKGLNTVRKQYTEAGSKLENRENNKMRLLKCISAIVFVIKSRWFHFSC